MFTEYVGKQEKDAEKNSKLLEKIRTGYNKNMQEKNHAKLARLCKNMFKV